MNKRELLAALRTELSILQDWEIEEYLNFYSEMIDDRIEEGTAENDVIASLGSVSEIAAKIKEAVLMARRETEPEQILSDGDRDVEPQAFADDGVAAQATLENKNTSEMKAPERRKNVWKIVALSVTSPIWGALLVAALAVVFSLLAAVWSVTVSFWAAFAAFAVSAPAGVGLGVFNIFGGNVLWGFTLIAFACALAGLAILAFIGCKWTTVGVARLTKITVRGIAKCFVRKEKQS